MCVCMGKPALLSIREKPLLQLLLECLFLNDLSIKWSDHELRFLIIWFFFLNSETEKHLKVGSMREEVAFLFLRPTNLQVELIFIFFKENW